MEHISTSCRTDVFTISPHVATVNNTISLGQEQECGARVGTFPGAEVARIFYSEPEPRHLPQMRKWYRSRENFTGCKELEPEP